MKTPRPCIGCVLGLFLGTVLVGCQTTKTELPNNVPYDILTGSTDWPKITPGSGRYWDIDEEAANRVAAAQLETIVSLRKDRLTMDQAISFIRDTTGANIAVNWPALELVDIDQDLLVTCHLNNVPARVLLQFILDQASGSTFEHDMAGFRISDGVVMVSTLYDLRPATETRVYEIRGLFQRPKLQASLYRNHERANQLIELLAQDDWWSRRIQATGFDLNDALSSTNSGGSPSTNHHIGLLRPDGEQKPEEETLHPLSYEDQVDFLAEIIQITVGDPDEWLDEESTLTEFNGKLIVKTTHENHEVIRQLLHRLEQSQVDHFKARVAVIEVFLLLEEAEGFRLKQDYGLAIEKIDQALRVDPNSQEARTLKGIIEQTRSR